jgi:Flp pilus assembly protein TadD
MELGELAKREAGPWTATQLAWAMLLSDNGEKISAEGVLQEILRRNERCYPACIELARICAATGKTNEAERHFKRAIDIRPGYPAALYSLGYFYKQNGRIDEALSLYQRLAELAPGDYTTFNNMAVIYVMKEDRAKAIAMLEHSLAIQPSIQAQSNLATLYFYMGSYRKSLPLFLEVAEKSGDCRGWGNLADTYRQLPEFQDQAAAAYRRAIALATSALGKNPEDFELLSVLALYYAHSQEKWKAMEAIVRARGLARGDLETIRRAILVYEAVGERRLALDALREFRERLGRVEEIEKEPDLAGLRRDAEYLELVREAK